MTASVPRAAVKVDQEYGFAEDGSRVVATVWRRNRWGDPGMAVFYIEQGLLTRGGTFVAAPHVKSYTGKSAEERVHQDFAEVRDLLLASRAPQPA